MPKHKPHRKHVRKFHRGAPVKPKVVRSAKRGAPRKHPSADSRITMLRSTEPERAQWDSARARLAELQRLPPGSISFNSWARSTLNIAAANTLGTELLPTNSDQAEPADPIGDLLVECSEPDMHGSIAWDRQVK
jgi:hypothetical protein